MNIKQIMIGRAKGQGPGITPEYDPTEYFLRSKRLNKNLKEPLSC